MSLTLPATNCAGDRFTATVRCSGQVAAVRHASRNTHAPILSMSRMSSATGMKTSGGMSVPSSAGRRISASKPIEAAVRHFEERLVVQYEAIMQHRVADDPLELDARLQLAVHLRQEEPDAIATVGLGLVERQVGALEQPLRAVAVLRRQRHSDAHRGEDLVLLELRSERSKRRQGGARTSSA